ncbi:UNVERIFIED_CONTAM: hypothetical protein Sradi_0058400 [Sesamum radiatum]|uniref:Uncharacterized protein n=1 Tax=Sesamum radiatum TaxID=300843 RepID=A0AAW2WLP1_SESRA
MVVIDEFPAPPDDISAPEVCTSDAYDTASETETTTLQVKWRQTTLKKMTIVLGMIRLRIMEISPK